MDITSVISYQGDLRCEAIHNRSKASIVTDAPLDNEGKGEAFSPTDLTATSLGVCMMTVMGIVARKRQINLKGTRIEITKIMSSAPRKISEVKVNIIFAGERLDQEIRNVLERTARECPVALSLHPDIKQDIRFQYS